ncbi:BON domain-containing protein [Mucilaginibacter robiniae]|uniref:BON domain-containing protein n=1 Tax=Mucilaginibacter robiniae TaxID=2728022 RepID=A0A7L5DWE9_9SPHI|nr:BON domain-containing protein [Mucilaginibacter robiniae]
MTQKLQQNPQFKEIGATVKDGVVTLSGNCENGDCDSLAAQQVKTVGGIKSIDNQIHKQEKTDLTLRTSVQSVVSKYDGVQADVAAGVVVLRGSIDKKDVNSLMTELQVLKPKKLDNQLAVK